MVQIKIKIRTQLLILVCCSTLFSLLILSIVTGVYFTSNLTKLRSDKLEVMSELKASQIAQYTSYYYYQIYSVASRDDVKDSLVNYKAGNTSSSNFIGAQDYLQEYLDSTENMYDAVLYDVNSKALLKVENKVVNTNLMDSVVQFLHPLSSNHSIPDSLNGTDGMLLAGPAINDTTYLVSLTLPIYGNSSILISTPDLTGYITVTVNAEDMYAATEANDIDASTATVIKSVASSTNSSDFIGYQYAFIPEKGTSNLLYDVSNFSSYPLVRDILENHITQGSRAKVTTPMNSTVAVGFTLEDMQSCYWIIFIEQDRSSFLSSTVKLTKIIVGVVIGIAAFMCLITFPLAHLAVRPIVKLQKATEDISYRRNLHYRKEKSIFVSKTNSVFSTVPNSPTSATEKDKNANINDKVSGYQGGDVIAAGAAGAADGTEDKINGRNSGSGGGTAGGNEESRNRNCLSSTYSSPTSDHFVIPQRVQHSRKIIVDELSELTEAFNVMTDELDRQYTHLEDRVRERTRELEKAKIEAESANEAKTVFISQISHELRTPLNGILGLCSVCMSETDINTIQESLKLVFRSGELLLHILTELLTFSKNTLKKSKLENRDFKILDIAWQIKSIFGKLANDQNVNLSILIRPNLIRKMILFGDSNRIIQVIMNLVSNSLKFTPVDGSVKVNIRCLGEYDEAKSKGDNYQHVYVKGRTANDETNNTSMDSSTSSGIIEKTHSKSVSTVTTKRRNNDSDESDSQSIHTLSTVEYSNAIFESQFRHRKKSSKLSISSATSSSSSSPPTSSSGVSKDIEQNGEADPSAEVTTSEEFKIKPLENLKKWVIEITVEDTGPGIEPALQEKVFEPFVQGDQTLSRTYGGTGLGLSISRQLATMMHGTLILESKVGEGSKFTFRIPLPQTHYIEVDSSEEESELYNDEFNVNSKKNRKVKVVDPGEAEEARDSLSEIANHDHKKMTSQLKIDDLPESVSAADAPPTPSTQTSGHSAQSPHGESSGSSYFDKPSVLTKSSTGTAPSSAVQTHSGVCVTGGTSDKKSDNENDNVKILVAEDNLVNQEVIKRMLNFEGLKSITLACDGQEAITILQTSLKENDSFDLIFMDVQMPKVDGLAATRIMRNELKYDKPIVALTAFADESNVTKCLDSGMSGFLSKPIRRSQLRKILVELCPDAVLPNTP
ncbi:hypothetical protein PACTADRAFT_49337 [Pachysolen tannophilus NRRL Y-2460]|uniref:histidine kinase n=1 Tax=Pachysolen tannophilus NRRL Y-2460 TaxID=669874 RepID=A0A1E4TVX7_PACTA|nr:hypothetical protein PACTADRAFT_49337 [Pachysolen tannophilus NRRL Y-2460]